MKLLDVDRLGKRYRLGLGGRGAETLWALRDVSFSVEQAEILGILGPNGAGKSTLLKILSRITEPTEGRATIRGRVGSLLEVGTGFHAELTGRENVFLSGALLGMSAAQVRERFDQIVAFAEVEPFIDTPVKRYSSGMYVRLAFAVAAHLRPDILIVDEVLAVGDLSFQRKCLEHMQRLIREGMTILLVSHNMAAIQTACTRALLLDHGRLVGEGPPVDIIERYASLVHLRDAAPELGAPAAAGARDVEVVSFALLDEDGRETRELAFGRPARIRIELEARRRIESPMVNFGVRRGDGVIVCNFNNWYDGFRIDHLEGRCSLEGWLPPFRVVPGHYEAHVLVWPWGGGHTGGLEAAQPLVARVFGSFQVVGVAFNWHDGVFQVRAQGWRFDRGGAVQECRPTGELPASILAASAGQASDS